MTQSRNAVSNLISRYRAVLKKCGIMNAFGTLAVAGMLVMGGVSGAVAAEVETVVPTPITGIVTADKLDETKGNSVTGESVTINVPAVDTVAKSPASITVEGTNSSAATLTVDTDLTVQGATEISGDSSNDGKLVINANKTYTALGGTEVGAYGELSLAGTHKGNVVLNSGTAVGAEDAVLSTNDKNKATVLGDVTVTKGTVDLTKGSLTIAKNGKVGGKLLMGENSAWKLVDDNNLTVNSLVVDVDLAMDKANTVNAATLSGKKKITLTKGTFNFVDGKIATDGTLNASDGTQGLVLGTLAGATNMSAKELTLAEFTGNKYTADSSYALTLTADSLEFGDSEFTLGGVTDKAANTVININATDGGETAEFLSGNLKVVAGTVNLGGDATTSVLGNKTAKTITLVGATDAEDALLNVKNGKFVVANIKEGITGGTVKIASNGELVLGNEDNLQFAENLVTVAGAGTLTFSKASTFEAENFAATAANDKIGVAANGTVKFAQGVTFKGDDATGQALTLDAATSEIITPTLTVLDNTDTIGHLNITVGTVTVLGTATPANEAVKADTITASGTGALVFGADRTSDTDDAAFGGKVDAKLVSELANGINVNSGTWTLAKELTVGDVTATGGYTQAGGIVTANEAVAIGATEYEGIFAVNGGSFTADKTVTLTNTSSKFTVNGGANVTVGGKFDAKVIDDAVTVTKGTLTLNGAVDTTGCDTKIEAAGMVVAKYSEIMDTAAYASAVNKGTWGGLSDDSYGVLKLTGATIKTIDLAGLKKVTGEALEDGSKYASLRLDGVTFEGALTGKDLGDVEGVDLFDREVAASKETLTKVTGLKGLTSDAGGTFTVGIKDTKFLLKGDSTNQNYALDGDGTVKEALI